MEKTEEEWRRDLTPEQYAVLRARGTEPPFTGQYVDTDTAGMYRCAACGQQLFSSTTKFHSGSGWPSFDDALPGSVELVPDDSHGMLRTEVICSRCKSHLGHKFDDGPQATTGQRYCINSCALKLDEHQSTTA